MFVTPAPLCFNPLIQIFGSPAILLPPSKFFSTQGISSNSTLEPLHTHTPNPSLTPNPPLTHIHTTPPSLQTKLGRRRRHAASIVTLCRSARAVYPPIYIPSPP